MPVGDLAIRLRADTADFESDMGRAAHVSEREMERMVARATAAGELIGRAIGNIATHFANAVKETFNYGEELAKAAQRTGFTVERLSEMEFAAKLNNVSFRELTTSIGFFEKQLAEAANENSRAGQLFRALGVDITQGPQKAFEQAVKAIDSLPDQEQKVAAMRALFTRTGDALLPFIGNLDEATQKAQQLGIVMSERMAKDAERFKDAMTTVEAAGRKWILMFEPAAAGLATFAEKIVDAKTKGDSFKVALVEVAKVWVAAWSVIPGLGDAAYNAFERLDNLAKRSGVSGKIGPAPGGEMGPPRSAANPEAVACAVSGGRWIDGRCVRGREGGRTPRDPSLSAEQVARMQAHADEEEAKTLSEAWKFVPAMVDKLEEWDRLVAAWGPDTFMGMSLEEAKAWVKNQFDAIDTMDDIEDRTKRVAAGFTEEGKAIEESTKKANDWAHQLGLTFSSAFEDAIAGGKKFSEILRGIASDLARMATRKLITEPLGSAFTKMLEGQGLSGEGLSGIIRGLFGGGASGNPNTIGSAIGAAEVADGFGGFVPALAGGTPYVKKSGLAVIHQGEAVVPASQNGRGGNTYITVAPNIDSRTDRAEVYSLVNRAVNDAVASIPDKARRGGTYSNSVRGR